LVLYTRWRKVWADFWSNKTRTLLMVSTILVGVFSVGLVNNMGRMMNLDMDNDFNSSNPSEAQISAYPLDETWVRSVRDIPGVGDAEGVYELIAKWVTPTGTTTNIDFYTIDSFEKKRLDVPKPVEAGGEMPPFKHHSVVFDRSAEALGIKPGDMVKVELPNGEKRELTFSGYIHNSTNFPYSMSNVVTGYVTRETGEWLGAKDGYNKLLVSIAENPTDRAHVGDVIKKITDLFDRSGLTGYGVSMYNPGHHFAWQITQGVVFILSFFGWLTVILSGFLIVNTIVALMMQQTKQIGVMKAIGAGMEQILPMYLVLLLGFGLLAFIVSVPLSSWGAALMNNFMGAMLNYETSPATFFPDIVIQQGLISFLVPVLAAGIPVINSLRKPVRESLSDFGISGGSKPKKGMDSKIKFIPRPILLSLRNAFRKKARTSLTFFTLVLAGAIFIAVFNLWSSFDKAMVDVQGYYLSDINVVLEQSYPFKMVSNVVKSIPGIEGVEGWLTIGGELQRPGEKKEDAIAFVAPPSDSTLIKPMMVSGRWLKPGDRNVIVVGNHLQKIRPDLKLNDWVRIKINDKWTNWQIIGFYRMPGNVNPPLIYTNYEYLSYETGMPNKVYELRAITYEHDGTTQSTISEALQKELKKRKISVSYVQTAAEWFSQQKSTTDVLAYCMLIMAVLIAVVGGLGLSNTMNLNVLERTREIGVMRAIGASNWNIQSIVVMEGIVIGLLSWILGAVLSIPFTLLLDYGVGISIFQSPLDAVYSWSGSFAWLIGVLLLATISSIAPASHASKIPIRETLAYE
jgi:putative ABC transport system permease protein